MSEQDKLQLKIEQAEPVVADAKREYAEAEPGAPKQLRLQLLLAEEKVLLAEKKALE